MIAIAVDDEPLMLGALVKAISASPDITEVVPFSGCNETLDFIKDHSAEQRFESLLHQAQSPVPLQAN